MLFTPNPNFKILTDEEFTSSIGSITEALSEHRNGGFFNGVGGLKLNYEYYLCNNASASVIIVHGMSEFTSKYHEMCYYLLNSGYNVFIYDQRGHGFSDRMTEPVDLVHVDRFNDYVGDLELFIDGVVSPLSDKPIYIYSHSMGGAVTALYLAKHSDKVQKAVLAAPMFAPVIGSTPLPIAIFGTWAKSVFAGKKSAFNRSKKFNPEVAERNATDESRGRFLHNLELRKKEPMYQSTPMSSGWVLGSITLLGAMRRRKLAKRIKTPLLLITAGNDTVVKNPPQNKFAEKCAACTQVILEGATHSIMTCSQGIITDYVNRILDFYRLPAESC